MAKNQAGCSKYDLSSVKSIFTGAAPLGAELAEELQKIYPTWKIRQAYGESLFLVKTSVLNLMIR